MTATDAKYSGPAQLLHWLISIMIVAQFALVWTADTLPRGDLRSLLMQWHVSIGFTVLVLAIVRLGWRFMHKPPAFPASMSASERMLASVTHWSLYALIVVMPLSGVFVVSTAGRDIDWFWLLTVPVGGVRNEARHEFFEGVHELLGWALLVLAVFHVLAAIWHVAVKKDGLLKRMLP